ncbi:MAG: hypothetical protein LBN27_13930 [Prevotellaceae bacterium]|jgi:hypothetical protein|nr:hypothetical protein [Prevotellaceae bacterium]
MKKVFSLAVAALFLLSLQGFAQTETSEDLQKVGKQPAFALDYNYSKKTVEEALALRLKNDKLKGSSSKGATKYEQVRYSTIADTPIDFYTKVTGDKKKATVYVFISKGYENFVTSGNDANVAARAKAFLQSLNADIQNYDLKNQTAAQEKEVKKAQKDYDKLVKKQKDLQKEQDKVAKELQKSEGALNTEKGKLDQLNSQK